MENHLSSCDNLERNKAEKRCWENCQKYLVDYDIVPSVFDSIDHHYHTNWQQNKKKVLLFLANIIPIASLINCSLYQGRFFTIVNHITPSCCSVEEHTPQVWVPSSPYQALLNTSLSFSLLIPFMPKGNQGVKNSYFTG